MELKRLDNGFKVHLKLLLMIDTMNYAFQKRKRYIRLIVPTLLLFFFIASPVDAQFYFGKNKVQYTSFKWQVMTTEHYKIYFYEEEKEIAAVAAKIAEDTYPPLAARFNIELSKKTPLIIYSSPSHFAQTNVIPGLLPESVGGFTEFLKGRVVLPFHGSYFDFEHVIIHELVHVFTLSKLGRIGKRQARRLSVFPPLWFTEGLAEYWSEGWDIEADMIAKDMVLRGELISIPDFWKVRGSYFMYKLGQSVCKFIEEEYGQDKLYNLFDNWIKGRNFDEIVKLTTGDNLAELSLKWEYSLKKKYYPEIARLDLPRMESDQLTFEGYSVKGVPISWDDGNGGQDWIVFMAYRLGYSGIYMKPRADNKSGLKTLVKGERSSRFESLHLLRTGIDATNSGMIIFPSKNKERDVLYLYDLNEKKVTRKYLLEELIAARSPRFSPDEKRVVFYGIRKSGYSDLFLLDLESGVIKALTDDIYYDIDPVFSLDGQAVVYASDRGGYGLKGSNNLFEIDLNDHNNIKQLTLGLYKDQTPEVTKQGIFFSSNREDSYNIFLLDNKGRLSRQSTFVTGAFDPRISEDGKQLIYSGYQDMRMQVYQIDLPPNGEEVQQLAKLQQHLWIPGQIDTSFRKASIRYDTDYSFDLAQSSIAYDPIYGSVGGFQASFSDMLGNRAYYLLLTNTADTKDELLKSFNFGLTYVNHEKRVNWGLGVFHLYDEYFNDKDQFFFERQAGIVGLASFPISKFSRMELTSFVRYDQKDRRFGLEDREGLLLSSFTGWVYDNSLWDITGPIEGKRYKIMAGLSYSLTHGRSWNQIVMMDIRHYFRLGANSAFANRLFGYSSGGLEPRRIYFGGSWNMRGYSRRHFYNRKIIFSSSELRFPLIDNLLIGLPIGGLGFRAIRGALFFDVGKAWDDNPSQYVGSYGWGVRVGLGYITVLRFDFSQRTDFHTTSSGLDFDFFFGWNF